MKIYSLTKFSLACLVFLASPLWAAEGLASASLLMDYTQNFIDYSKLSVGPQGPFFILAGIVKPKDPKASMAKDRKVKVSWVKGSGKLLWPGSQTVESDKGPLEFPLQGEDSLLLVLTPDKMEGGACEATVELFEGKQSKGKLDYKFNGAALVPDEFTPVLTQYLKTSKKADESTENFKSTSEMVNFGTGVGTLPPKTRVSYRVKEGGKLVFHADSKKGKVENSYDIAKSRATIESRTLASAGAPWGSDGEDLVAYAGENPKVGVYLLSFYDRETATLKKMLCVTSMFYSVTDYKFEKRKGLSLLVRNEMDNYKFDGTPMSRNVFTRDFSGK